MSFSEQWFSKSDPKGKRGKRDKTSEQGAFAPFAPKFGESEKSEIDQWGEHALLAGWFLSVKDTLPRERFVYDQGKGWQVIWATPAASYENLAREIEKPPGQWEAEVRSILERLHELFGQGVRSCAGLT